MDGDIYTVPVAQTFALQVGFEKEIEIEKMNMEFGCDGETAMEKDRNMLDEISHPGGLLLSSECLTRLLIQDGITHALFLSLMKTPDAVFQLYGWLLIVLLVFG